MQIDSHTAKNVTDNKSKSYFVFLLCTILHPEEKTISTKRIRFVYFIFYFSRCSTSIGALLLYWVLLFFLLLLLYFKFDNNFDFVEVSQSRNKTCCLTIHNAPVKNHIRKKKKIKPTSNKRYDFVN